MKIAIGADHRGFNHKKFIIDAFKNDPIYTFTDVGTDSAERTDYPLYAEKVVELMKSGQVEQGILLCGNGVGMAIAANRNKQIYAAVVASAADAIKAKEDDNINLLVLPSDYLSDDQLIPIIRAWLNARFKGGRYAERIAMVDK
jgi:ribose 5-phosphate isomerase B